MSEALLAQIVTLLGIVGVIVQKIIDGKKRDAKLNKIHVLVNSRLTEAIAETAVLKTEIDELKKRLEKVG